MAPGTAFADRVSSHQLTGGARLAVLANPHAPTATVAGTLLAGPAQETNGRFAVPAMVAAMLDRGTTEHSRIELARELEDHGDLIGRFTNRGVLAAGEFFVCGGPAFRPGSSTSFASRFVEALSVNVRRPPHAPSRP